jgi:hypothetical protein
MSSKIFARSVTGTIFNPIVPRSPFGEATDYIPISELCVAESTHASRLLLQHQHLWSGLSQIGQYRQGFGIALALRQIILIPLDQRLKHTLSGN